MACTTLTGYTLGCRDSIGGIQKVYIGNWNDGSMGYTYSTDGIISGFTGTTQSFFTFEQEVETANFTQAGQFSNENGTAFYEQTLEITLQKMDAALRNQVLTLGQGKWRIIVLDQRGNYWLLGKQNPVRVSASTPGVGKAYGDLNGAMITFTGKEPEPAHAITSAAALTVIV